MAGCEGLDIKGPAGLDIGAAVMDPTINDFLPDGIDIPSIARPLAEAPDSRCRIGRRRGRDGPARGGGGGMLRGMATRIADASAFFLRPQSDSRKLELTLCPAGRVVPSFRSAGRCPDDETTGWESQLGTAFSSGIPLRRFAAMQVPDRCTTNLPNFLSISKTRAENAIPAGNLRVDLKSRHLQPDTGHNSA